jgi:hypothetical protein
MQVKLGHGDDAAGAFEKAVQSKYRGSGIVKVLDRPARTRATAVAATFEGSTEGGWFAVPASYIEAHDYKVEKKMAKVRAKVFIFFKT